MNNLQSHIKNYLEFCQYQKRLDKKTLKAYRIDLRQFSEHVCTTAVPDITPDTLEGYIAELHQKYKPKTSKRKIQESRLFIIFCFSVFLFLVLVWFGCWACSQPVWLILRY